MNFFKLFVLFIFILPTHECYSQKKLRIEALNRYQLKKSDTLYQLTVSQYCAVSFGRYYGIFIRKRM